jgi:hypothetical protein
VIRYNSSFFSTLATNDYDVLYVSEDFVNGGGFNTSITSGLTTLDVASVQWHLHSYETLQNADCINAYAVDLVTTRRTLVIVTTNTSSHDNSLLGLTHYTFENAGKVGTQYSPYEW